MCSIVGLVNYHSVKDKSIDNESFFLQSFDLMKKRGPDNQTYLKINDHCALGHQRLSIIDIDEKSNQPMHFGDYHIVFNGEIYNYLEIREELELIGGIEFETGSDTEVLIKAYEKFGLKVLNKLNGMFAFALYNSKEKELLMVRDRFGVKPLHYMLQDGTLYFSSEIKPLIQIKDTKKINLKLYQNFFKHTATDYNEETFIQDIYQVKKGHYIRFRDKPIEKQWYYGNDYNFDKSIFKSRERTIDFVEDLLVHALEIRLRADVPICLTLSGGIDSTTLYTLIKERLKKDIKVFTYIHPGSITNENEKVIQLVDSYNDFVCTVQSNNTEGFSELSKDLEIVEFPIWGISTRAYKEIYDSIKLGGYKVVIEGHGSDEQLGGYPYMIESAFYDLLKKLKLFKAFEIYRIEKGTIHTALFAKKKNYPTLLIRILKLLLAKGPARTFQETIDWTFNFKILPIVLRAFDRLSMASSIESRAPFMDYRIVEVFKQLPLEYKVNKIGNKAILREILKKYKKTYIYQDKQKMGFASDLPKFFNDPNNKKKILNQVLKFNMYDFRNQKEEAINIVSKDIIHWSDTTNLSKVLLISMINEIYKLNTTDGKKIK